jgi:hypothetical protein
MRAVIIAGATAAMCLAVVLIYPWGSRTIVWDRDKAVSVPRVLKSIEVQVGDLPAVVEAMSRGSAAVRWAALAFTTPDRATDDDALNIQISIENGKVGFDWVLLGPRNIEDQEKFRTFVRARGIEPVRRTVNGVQYLRVESADAADLAASIVTEMYHLPPSEPLGLFHEGFDWPQT